MVNIEDQNFHGSGETLHVHNYVKSQQHIATQLISGTFRNDDYDGLLITRWLHIYSYELVHNIQFICTQIPIQKCQYCVLSFLPFRCLCAWQRPNYKTAIMRTKYFLEFSSCKTVRGDYSYNYSHNYVYILITVG